MNDWDMGRIRVSINERCTKSTAHPHRMAGTFVWTFIFYWNAHWTAGLQASSVENKLGTTSNSSPRSSDLRRLL